MQVPTQQVLEQHIGSRNEEQDPKIKVHCLSFDGACVGISSTVPVSLAGVVSLVNGACDGDADGVSDGVSVGCIGACDAGDALGEVLGR